MTQIVEFYRESSEPFASTVVDNLSGIPQIGATFKITIQKHHKEKKVTHLAQVVGIETILRVENAIHAPLICACYVKFLD